MSLKIGKPCLYKDVNKTLKDICISISSHYDGAFIAIETESQSVMQRQKLIIKK